MRQIRHLIISFIDFFHKPFARWIPTQTFRYLACGGSNTVLNWVLYTVGYYFVFKGNDFHLTPSIIIRARQLAYVFSFCINFPIGFVLSRYIVFPESNLRGKVQLFRYALATFSFIVLTVILIKFFAMVIPFVRPEISYIFVMVITAVLSYLSQRFYTFK